MSDCVPENTHDSLLVAKEKLLQQIQTMNLFDDVFTACTKRERDNDGCSSISMCIWSGIACASIIFTCFRSHNSLSIAPISALKFPYIAFLLYFGAKTM